VAMLAGSVGAQAPELPDVLARAAQYVAQLETALPAVVVDEDYAQTAQTTKNLGGSNLGVGGGPTNMVTEGSTSTSKRKSRSELLLVRRSAAPLVWSGARNVLDIDGKATGNAPGRLDGLLTEKGALDRQWAALADETRKVQIGAVVRTPHVAWTALALLRSDQQGRVVFKKSGEEKIGGVTAWKVSFLEQKGPALLRSSGNVQLPSSGFFWIDPQTGQVLRTKLELGTSLNMEQLRIEVEYAMDAGLGVLVPVSMKERFENEKGKVDGKVTFTRYRKISGI
jgi:hypothetical protein